MSSPNDPAAWLEKVASDMLCIENNLKGEKVPWDAIAFHAQQAAEKALKAFLARRKRPIPFVHDLEQLRTECLACSGPFDNLGDDCDFLTPLGVFARYPGPSVDEPTGREAIAAATRIRDSVLRVLGEIP